MSICDRICVKITLILQFMRNLTAILYFILVFLLLPFPFIAESQSFHIGGYKAVYDSVNGRWLCSVPRAYFGSDWSTTLEADSTFSTLVVNGKKAINGEAVVFEDISGGKLYPVNAVVNGAPVTGAVTFTWLPVMELDGVFGNSYRMGTVSMNIPDEASEGAMIAKVKWRGNVTNTSGKHKRNYSIKFVNEDGSKKDRRFFGLRKDNHWKLDAGQPDRLRIRNRVCTDLWLDMSRPVWYQETEPEAINGARGRMIEVILNGQYQGIYNMMEPVDRKQLKLVKHDTINNEFHGQLWCCQEWCRTGTMSNPAEWSNSKAKWEGIEVEYPDFDDVSPTDWNTLADAIMFTYTTERAKRWNELADSLDYYFDMPVMVDYLIFIVALQALDNESKNIYYACHDKAENPRLTLTPWDLDVSVGAQSFSYLTADVVNPERPVNWLYHIPMTVVFGKSNRFHDDMNKRYWELRDTWLNTDSLINRFQRVIDELEQCGASAREEARWSHDSDIGGVRLDLSREMSYVADWITKRMAYLDENVFERPVEPKPLVGDINKDGEISVADINALIEVVLGTAADSDTIQLCDLNGDREITVSDINQLINLIMQL